MTEIDGLATIRSFAFPLGQRRSRNNIMALEEARRRKLVIVHFSAMTRVRSCAKASPITKRGPRRLHPAHSGRAGVHLPRLYENIKALAMAKYELYGTRTCPYIEEMREWLNFNGSKYLEYDVEAAAALSPMLVLSGGRRTVQGSVCVIRQRQARW
jgi:glutaredoxin 3